MRISRFSLTLSITLLFLCSFLALAADGSDVTYVGGTLSEFSKKTKGQIFTTDNEFFYFRTKQVTIRVPYDRINLLEYGQKVRRRIELAVLVSPLLLFSKARKHYLTIGYEDGDGHQQIMVFEVDKDDIRPLLVSLEGRTGLEVQFQDEEARKAGRGG